MITISIDDQIEVGKEIVHFMQKIDPDGEHYAYSDTEAALALIHEKHPDVAWLDVEMPGKSGLELSMDIKTISPMTNIIFVTGHEKFAYQTIRLHPSGFVLKPVTEEEVRVELDNLRFPVEREQKKALIRVQCFGNFEVFDQEGQPVTFQRTREKEVLAYLIDRRGALCSSGELSAGIFEEGTGEQSQKTSVALSSQGQFAFAADDDAVSFKNVTDPIVNLLNSFITPIMALVGAGGAIYCIFLGVKYATAEEPQEREKRKQSLKTAIIGFVLIFVLIVALRLSIEPLTEWMQKSSNPSK